MTLVPAPVRSLALLALVNALADAAFLPLVPAIRDDLRLTGAQTGALLAATTVAALVGTIPVAQLGARIGARPLLLAAAMLMPISLAGMALAPGLWALLAARMLFGLSFTVNWAITPGLAASRVSGARGTAALLAVSGVGWLVGPMAAGVLTSLWGWRVPLALIALLAVPTALPFLRRGTPERVGGSLSLREAFALATTSAPVAWSAAVAALLGLVTGAIGVLVPTLLADNGMSPAGIGAAVTLSSVVWIAAAAGSGRITRPLIGLRLVGLTVAALAACWALPVLSLSNAALTGFLVLAAACRAPLGALIYPLATRASDGEGSATTIASVLNVAWAMPALVAPLLAGVAMEQGLARATFAAVCVVAAAIAVGMLGTARRLAAAV